MTKAELIKELEKFPDDLPVKTVMTSTTYYESYPYSSSEDIEGDSIQIDMETRYNKKTKEREIIAIVIRGN